MIKTVRYVIISVAVAFIAYGIIREEHLTVLRKAVRVCFECIGIG